MDWVHCNNCYTRVESGLKFFLTSCGHIFCANCQLSCTEEGCKLCKSMCTTLQLSSKMKPDIEIFFTEPFETLKKHIEKLQQVIDFQRNHQARFTGYLVEQFQKYKLLKEQYKKVIEKFKECDSEKRRMRKEIDYFKRALSNSNYRPPQNFPDTPDMRNIGYPHKQNDMYSENSVMSGSGIISPSSTNVAFRPKRISILTPPKNGRMGVIRGSTGSGSAEKLNFLRELYGSEQKRTIASMKENCHPSHATNASGLYGYFQGQGSASSFDAHYPRDGLELRPRMQYNGIKKKATVSPFSPLNT